MAKSHLARVMAVGMAISGDAAWTITRTTTEGVDQSCTAQAGCCSAPGAGPYARATFCFDSATKHFSLTAGNNFGGYTISTYKSPINSASYYGWFTKTGNKAPNEWPLDNIAHATTGTEKNMFYPSRLCFHEPALPLEQRSPQQCCSMNASLSCSTQGAHAPGLVLETLAQHHKQWRLPGHNTVPVMSVKSVAHSYMVTASDEHYNSYVKATGGPFWDEAITITYHSHVDTTMV